MKDLVARITQFIKQNQTTVILVAGLAIFLAMIIIGLVSQLGPKQPATNNNNNNASTPSSSSPGGGIVILPTDSDNASSTTTINNYDSLVNNLSDSEKINIETVLYLTIGMNQPSQTAQKPSAIIRDGSYQQTLQDPGKQIYFTTFMVDIPEIRQSYRVNNYYSPLPPSGSGLFDYTNLVLCPANNELIYEPFSCIDRLRQEQENI